jgi:hypothetical protein
MGSCSSTHIYWAACSSSHPTDMLNTWNIFLELCSCTLLPTKVALASQEIGPNSGQKWGAFTVTKERTAPTEHVFTHCTVGTSITEGNQEKHDGKLDPMSCPRCPSCSRVEGDLSETRPNQHLFALSGAHSTVPAAWTVRSELDARCRCE